MRLFFTNRYRHIQRYREIINVFSKHGFGYLLELTGLSTALRMPWRKKKLKEPPLSVAKRLKMVLEELGPTFIKLGQIISTRPDLLPEVYISQLELLQDRVVPVPFGEIKRAVEAELGQPIEKIFLFLNSMPIASASIGQVHEAALLTGEHVVVKVQRAGLDQLIETDLEIMYDVAGFLEARTEWGKLYRIQSFLDEFSRTIRDELDYIMEAKNAERFRENFRGDATVYFPKVYWECTTQRVLALEYVSGIKVTAETELEGAGISRSETVRRIANAFFKQVLIDGFFHADPHPGNITIGKDGVIVFMDFGMVGRIESSMKEQLGAVLLGVIRRDVNGILKVLNELGDGPPKTEQHDFKRQLYYLFDKYYNRPLQEIKIGSVFPDLLRILSGYHARIPQEVIMIGRCLLLLENVVERLDPKSSLIELAKPFGPKLLMEKFTPQNISKMIQTYLWQLGAIAAKLPEKVDNLLQMATDGELKVVLEHFQFDQFISRLIVLGNRLSFSIIIASIIMGSSFIALKTPVSIFGNLPIAEFGFIVAALMGIWLLVSIIKSGRI